MLRVIEPDLGILGCAGASAPRQFTWTNGQIIYRKSSPFGINLRHPPRSDRDYPAQTRHPCWLRPTSSNNWTPCVTALSAVSCDCAWPLTSTSFRLVGGPDALPRIYWHARGQQSPEYVALGAIHELTRPEDIQRVCDLAGTASEDSPRYYGGLAFDPDLPGWQGFGPRRFVLPRIELVRRGVHQPLPQSLAACPGRGSRIRSRTLRRRGGARCPATRGPCPPCKAAMAAPGPAGPCPVADPGGAGHGPDFQARTPKVVLSLGEPAPERGARCAPLPLVPADTVGSATPRSASHFGFQFSPSRASSPAPPSASTAGRRATSLPRRWQAPFAVPGMRATDAALAAELLADSKNRLENRLVHADILSRLAPHDRCHPDRAAHSEIAAAATPQVRHRGRAQTRRLRLATAGCPAPHPAGAPREAALAFIRECEPHDRGWYAGACGMLSRETSEFSVAIRSARIRGRASACSPVPA